MTKINKILDMVMTISIIICLCLSIIALQNKPIILAAYTEIQTETVYEKLEYDNLSLAKPFLIHNDFKTYFTPLTRVPLLTHPNQNSLGMGYLWIEDIVEILVKTDDWYAIKYNDKLAYILTDSLNCVIDIDFENESESLEVLDDMVEIETNPNNQDKETHQQQIEELIETNDVLYVQSETLNIRKGPGTSFEKIGTFSQNDEVFRIGYSKNGWSKIKYNNAIAFVYTDYLASHKVEKPKPESVAEEIARRSGMLGRLSIPSVGLNVALFGTSMYENSQSIVDKADSAAYLYDKYGHYGMNIIADHKHQGFSAMKKSIPNQTYAYIDYGTYTEKYICTANFTGHNTGHYLTTDDYVEIHSPNDKTICMYTCNDNWQNVTITYWELC